MNMKRRKNLWATKKPIRYRIIGIKRDGNRNIYSGEKNNLSEKDFWKAYAEYHSTYDTVLYAIDI